MAMENSFDMFLTLASTSLIANLGMVAYFRRKVIRHEFAGLVKLLFWVFISQIFIDTYYIMVWIVVEVSNGPLNPRLCFFTGIFGSFVHLYHFGWVIILAWVLLTVVQDIVVSPKPTACHHGIVSIFSFACPLFSAIMNAFVPSDGLSVCSLSHASRVLLFLLPLCVALSLSMLAVLLSMFRCWALSQEGWFVIRDCAAFLLIFISMWLPTAIYVPLDSSGRSPPALRIVHFALLSAVGIAYCLAWVVLQWYHSPVDPTRQRLSSRSDVSVIRSSKDGTQSLIGWSANDSKRHDETGHSSWSRPPGRSVTELSAPVSCVPSPRQEPGPLYAVLNSNNNNQQNNQPFQRTLSDHGEQPREKEKMRRMGSHLTLGFQPASHSNPIQRSKSSAGGRPSSTGTGVSSISTNPSVNAASSSGTSASSNASSAGSGGHDVPLPVLSPPNKHNEEEVGGEGERSESVHVHFNVPDSQSNSSSSLLHPLLRASSPDDSTSPRRSHNASSRASSPQPSLGSSTH